MTDPIFPRWDPRELSEEDRARSAYGEFRFANQGDVLISQGSPTEAFFIISGVLHAFGVTPIARCSRRIRRGNGWAKWSFSILCAMCSVIVIEQTQYWTITRSDLEVFINNYPQAGVQLVISLPRFSAGAEIGDKAADGRGGTGVVRHRSGGAATQKHIGRQSPHESRGVQCRVESVG